MKFSLEKSGIVLGAEAHNPSIISPHWLKANNLINEEPEKFLHTVEVSMIELKDIHIFVDRDLMQITAKKDSNDVRKYLIDIIKGYIELLPHIPYKTLDLNFHWIVKLEESDSRPDIKLSIGKTNLQKAVESKNELAFGGTIYVCKKLYHLKINIQPMDEKKIVILFYYQYDTESKKPSEIKENIDNFLNFFKDSRKILKNIFDNRSKE
jgi:hypothetical protein